MKRQTEYKYVNASIKAIVEFKEKKTFTISSKTEYINEVPIDIWFSENKFQFRINCVEFLNFEAIYKNIDNIFNTEIIKNGDLKYTFLKYTSDNIKIGLASQVIEGELNSIIQDDLKSFDGNNLRFLIPFNSNENIGVIENYKSLETDQDITYGVGYNELLIMGFKFHVCKISIENISYLMIDLFDNCEIKLADKIIDSLLISFSYLFGTDFRSDCFILSSLDIGFQRIDRIAFYARQKNYGHRSPIYNSHEIRNLGFSENYFQLSPKVLTTFCEKLNSDKQFLRAIEIYIEATQNKYSLSRCILYSTCIETIIGLVKLKEATNPIELERYKNSDISSQFHHIVEESKYLTRDDKEFLIIRKLPYLNSPTNPDKIELSISNFNIQLPDKFKKALKYRNQYLHGSIPKGNLVGSVNTDNSIRASELQFLVNIIILKMVGYKGYIKNYSAEIEYNARKEQNTDNLQLNHPLYYEI